GAQQRPRQARRAAASVDADFASWKRPDVETRSAQLVIRLAIFFNREQAPSAQGQNVAGKRVALGVIDFDKLKSTRLQQVDSFDRQPRQVNQSGVVVKKADQRHQVKAGGRSGTVRQWCGEDGNAHGGKQIAQLLYAVRVRAISAANEERLVVEPY